MLKHLFKSVAIGVLFSSSLQAVAQTEVLIKLKDAGEEKKYVVEDKGKLSFSSTKLFIEQKASDAVVSYDLNSIRTVRFVQGTSGNETVFADGGGVFLYPNPATDVFYLANGEDGVMVNLYSVDGALLLRQKYVQEAGVSVSGLPDGLYIVEVANQMFKLEKR